MNGLPDLEMPAAADAVERVLDGLLSQLRALPESQERAAAAGRYSAALRRAQAAAGGFMGDEVRRVRRGDPDAWSYDKLAAFFGVTKTRIVQIMRPR